MRSLRSLLLAMLIAPAAVRAADIPVVYTVDTTALKLAISGTNLTFELHTNVGPALSMDTSASVPPFSASFQ